MATGGIGKFREEAEDSVNKLTCAICLEKYRRPKLLGCFHTFCQSCLQGVAGSSATFLCPSCRTLVLLPPGGVAVLQTNFYIEEDLTATTSSPQPRLCDICTRDREATHTCIQCRQKFCRPCCKYHDAFSWSRGHTVVSLIQDEAEGCGSDGQLSEQPEDSQRTQMCPKHPDQQLLLHCSQCKTDICMQCKLTKHDGHPTDDLVDVRAEARSKLQDMMGSLTQRMKEVDHLVAAFNDRRDKLHYHQQVTEQGFKDRAATLHQWVNQSLEEAVTSLQTTSKELEKSTENQIEQLKNHHLALQAQRDHIMRVLKDRKEADLLSLESQLSSSLCDHVDVKQVEKEVTKDIPAFPVRHNATAVNQLQLRAFIGVLEPIQQPGGRSSTIQAETVAVKGAKSHLAKNLDFGDVMPVPTTARKPSDTVQKKRGGEFTYSGNPQSTVVGMCPISENHVWVCYKPAPSGSVHMKLFDAAGQVLRTVNNVDDGRFYTIANDLILCLPGIFQTFVPSLIRPDGTMTHHTLQFQIGNTVSSTTNDTQYMSRWDGKTSKIRQVKFVFTNTGNCDRPQTEDVGADSLTSADTANLAKQLAVLEIEVVFEKHPERFLECVSAGGCYFAFIYNGRINIYMKQPGKGSGFVCSYTVKTPPIAIAARFCLIGGEERMLVIVHNDNKVHVVDHTDGGCFVRYLDTGPQNLYRPNCLATDFDRHVWIGCEGGKVVMVDL